MRLVSASISVIQISHAFPKPTIPGTFSVPLRIPRSWPPPSIWAVTFTLGFFLRTYNAPTPLGPYILCAVKAIKSMPSLLTSTGILPMACVLSEKTNAPCFRAIALISLMGCTVPISLFACIMATKIVVGLIAASSAFKSISPSLFTGK